MPSIMCTTHSRRSHALMTMRRTTRLRLPIPCFYNGCNKHCAAPKMPDVSVGGCNIHNQLSSSTNYLKCPGSTPEQACASAASHKTRHLANSSKRHPTGRRQELQKVRPAYGLFGSSFVTSWHREQAGAAAGTGRQNPSVPARADT
jgi:hypothetical protein